MADEIWAQQLQDATNHIQKHIHTIAAEITLWRNTGILRDGELRRAAEMIDTHDAISLVEGIAIRECLALCAISKDGNND